MTKKELIEQNINLRAKLEVILEYLKDKGIIKSWYYNGSYHWEVAE